MKRTTLYVLAVGCVICVGICASRIANAGDEVDCSKLTKWDMHHTMYDKDTIVWSMPQSQGYEYKCTASPCKSPPGIDSQWTVVGKCKVGTDPR